jgi:pyruvate/2-oxoglutarate dehydrogenase complex dihydrolipoamide acyltransferase (E2) component
MNTRAALRFSPLVLTLAATLLTACAKQEEVSEVEWAKSALARNPALEILSTDEVAGIFTVRDTTSGSTYKLHTNELMAAPPPPKAAPPAAQPAPAVETTAAVETPAQPGEAAASQTTELVVTKHGAGEPLVEGPGYRISRGDTQDAAPRASLEGPGYSITHERAAEQPAAPDVPAVAAVEKRSEPIVCQGERLMHIDGETMEFTGDAVIAENGCDLYISNASIRAGGVGIIARQARVHIVNSTIGGSLASYEASEGAQIYVARSTVAGVGRRFDTARMNDLGGNEYPLTH